MKHTETETYIVWIGNQDFTGETTVQNKLLQKKHVFFFKKNFNNRAPLQPSLDISWSWWMGNDGNALCQATVC